MESAAASLSKPDGTLLTVGRVVLVEEKGPLLGHSQLSTRALGQKLHRHQRHGQLLVVDVHVVDVHEKLVRDDLVKAGVEVRDLAIRLERRPLQVSRPPGRRSKVRSSSFHPSGPENQLALASALAHAAKTRSGG